VIRAVKPCSLHFPGHTVHWIQVRRAGAEPGVVEDGLIADVGEDVIRVRIGAELREYRNHDTARIRDIVRERGPRVTVQERWSLLRFPSPGGNYCVSIVESAEPWVACRE
jgi:hypothetical protein